MIFAQALHNVGVADPVIQASTDKPDEVLIKIPLVENTTPAPPTLRHRTRKAGQI